MLNFEMCKGVGCPVKENCKRFNTEPEMNQSYFAETPGKEVDIRVHTKYGSSYGFGKGWQCEMYWAEEQDDIMARLMKITGVTLEPIHNEDTGD